MYIVHWFTWLRWTSVCDICASTTKPSHPTVVGEMHWPAAGYYQIVWVTDRDFNKSFIFTFSDFLAFLVSTCNTYRSLLNRRRAKSQRQWHANFFTLVVMVIRRFEETKYIGSLFHALLHMLYIKILRYFDLFNRTVRRRVTVGLELSTETVFYCEF